MSKRSCQVTKIEKTEIKDNFVLAKTSYSGISPGTELMQINKKLDKEIHLVYSASGVVEEVGEGVSHLKKGDNVTCYGAPYVKHTEYLLVLKNLASPVPDHMDLKKAAFVGLGAIAIQSLRQAELRFGEHIVVFWVGHEIIDQALSMTRDRRIVIVGDLNMRFLRELFFRKEANISIFRAEGPGLYDTLSRCKLNVRNTPTSSFEL